MGVREPGRRALDGAARLPFAPPPNEWGGTPLRLLGFTAPRPRLRSALPH